MNLMNKSKYLLAFDDRVVGHSVGAAGLVAVFGEGQGLLQAQGGQGQVVRVMVWSIQVVRGHRQSRWHHQSLRGAPAAVLRTAVIPIRLPTKKKA